MNFINAVIFNNQSCEEAETLKPLPGKESRINQQSFLPNFFSFNILLKRFLARWHAFGNTDAVTIINNLINQKS